jgi:hypothetical protein
MKKAFFLSILFLFVMVESIAQRQAVNNDIIIVDVTKSYSQKKELILQDFMDVEYVALETNDEFVNQGVVLDVGRELILVRNRIDDGNIFVYDRKGKALRKINCKGQSGKEYINNYSVILDEDNKEMFVCDRGKIIVYDFFGEFIRSIRGLDNVMMFYTKIYNYDKDNLICYDKDNSKIPFVLISKQDGRITQEIKIPFVEKKNLQQKQPISGMNVPPNIQIPDGFQVGRMASALDAYRPIIPYNGNWILLEFSSDTIYTFLPDYNLRPIIARTPSIQSMSLEVMLTLRLVTERYYFMETIRNEYNFDNETGFPRTYFIYDKKEKKLSQYAVYNGDFLNKKEIYMFGFTPVKHECESWYKLETNQLVEDYKKGILKGELKEIVSKLDEDDNPVIMLVKHRK